MREPITAELLELGLQSLKELAREPVSVIGEGNSGKPSGLYILQSLNALKSGAKGQELPKRLDRLDLNKSQNKLRSNWRERLSGVKSVKTADTVTAKYRLSRREFPVETAGRLDLESETLWLRSGPEMEESFFDVIADLIFEQPQQYLGSMLQRAYKMELRERNPRLMPEEGGSQDEPNIDEPEYSGDFEVGWEKWTPKSDKLERRRCQDEEGPARKVYQGIPAGSSEAGIGRESVIARGRASVVLSAIDVGVLGEAI